MTVPDCTENPFRARLGEPKNQQRLRRSHTESVRSPRVLPKSFNGYTYKTYNRIGRKKVMPNEITEKFFGFWVITSICLAFGFPGHSQRVATKNTPTSSRRSKSGERNVDDEKRSSRGYLRKYLFSTPLHFDWPSSSSKFILRFCVRPSPGLFPSLH